MPMQFMHSATLKWSPASQMKTHGYSNARCKSSHHCPKSLKGAIANNVKIEHIGTPHTTVSQHAEQVMMRKSRCNDIKIERSGKSHKAASQQAEQVRIVTGQRTTLKDDQAERE